MTTDWIACTSHDFCKGGTCSCYMSARAIYDQCLASQPTKAFPDICRVRGRSRLSVNSLLQQAKQSKHHLPQVAVFALVRLLSNKHSLPLTLALLQGPVLKTEEGQEGAVLCNDDESWCTASRGNSLADCGLQKQSSFEAVQCK